MDEIVAKFSLDEDNGEVIPAPKNIKGGDIDMSTELTDVRKIPGTQFVFFFYSPDFCNVSKKSSQIFFVCVEFCFSKWNFSTNMWILNIEICEIQHCSAICPGLRASPQEAKTFYMKHFWQAISYNLWRYFQSPQSFRGALSSFWAQKLDGFNWKNINQFSSVWRACCIINVLHEILHSSKIYFLSLSVSHDFMTPTMFPTNPKIWSKMKLFTKIIKNQQKLIFVQIPATDL